MTNRIMKGTKTLILPMIILFAVGCISLAHGAQEPQPQDIPADISCGKCGMYPAKYPQWQTQVVFTDGSMQPFDGCKCMFGYLFKMSEYDKTHMPADVAAVWVRDYNTGEWINGKKAHYVIGSSEMGPMGKELIPFGDAAAAEAFQEAHQGHLAMYDEINMATLKPLMGKMHMKGKKMKGQMDM